MLTNTIESIDANFDRIYGAWPELTVVYKNPSYTATLKLLEDYPLNDAVNRFAKNIDCKGVPEDEKIIKGIVKGELRDFLKWRKSA